MKNGVWRVEDGKKVAATRGDEKKAQTSKPAPKEKSK